LQSNGLKQQLTLATFPKKNGEGEVIQTRRLVGVKETTKTDNIDKELEVRRWTAKRLNTVQFSIHNARAQEQ
jgi:hypothetical protein